MPTYPADVIADALGQVFKTDDTKVALAIKMGNKRGNWIASLVEREVGHAFRQWRQTWAQ